MTPSTRAALLAATLVAAAAPCLAQDEGEARLLSPDRGFGRGGFVRTIRADRARLDSALFVRLDAKGRLVVAGRRIAEGAAASADPDFVPVVARLLPDGRLDGTYGVGGIAELPLRGSPMGFDLDAEGRAVTCGEFQRQADTVVAARLLDDGTLDPSFSGDGMAEDPTRSASMLRNVYAAPDGSLLGIAGGRAAGVMRIGADGAIDATYGGDGFAEIAFDDPSGLAVDAQGRAVVAGTGGVVRYAADGSLDATFGAGGALVGPHGAAFGTEHVSIDGVGRISAYGHEDPFAVGVFRFLADGAVDPSFGQGGVVAVRLDAPGGSDALGLDFAASHVADEFVLFAGLAFNKPGSTRTTGYGWFLQAIDAAAPDVLATYARRGPRGRHVWTGLAGGVVADDGDSAVVVGGVETRNARDEVVRETPLVLRLDLAHGKRRTVSRLSIRWADGPRAAGDSGDASGASFEGAVRIANAGRVPQPDAWVNVFLSRDAVLDASDRHLFDQQTGRIPAGGSRRVKLPSTYVSLGAPPRGMRLIAVVQGGDADPRRGVAVSAPLE